MLDKRSRNIVLAFGIALLVILISEIVRPKPINWSPSYTAQDKTPFGSYVLFEELETLFGDSEIQKIKRDPFDFLQKEDSKENTAYVFINDDLSFDKRQIELFKEYVESGNTIFMSARDFGPLIADSLQISTQPDYSILEEDLKAKLFRNVSQADSMPHFKKGVYKSVFNEIDTLRTSALGSFDTENLALEELNYISVEYGKGKFLFHTLPETFSNYYLLSENQNYAARILSYIDADTIYWDSYLKSGRKIVSSPMRYIFDQKPLKWAYYTVMLGLILFVLIKGKREQRVIEVIEPLENTSIEFTKTIGDLYFQHKDFGNIIAKKITYFLEQVRSKHYLSTDELNDEFIEKLALKSSNSVEQTKKLIEYIIKLKGKTLHIEKDIIELNKLIEEYKL